MSQDHVYKRPSEAILKRDVSIAKEFIKNIVDARIKKDNITDPEECNKILKETTDKVSELFKEATGKDLYN